MAIDKTYFIGEINIAQTSQTPVVAALTLFISKYGAQYLEKALGYAFAKLYTDGIAADTVDARWTDLKNGAEYNDCNGHLKKWTGFENSDLRSPLANYIYYWYTRDNATFTSGSSEKKGKSDNADNASPKVKQARAWNEMVKMTCSLHDFLKNKKDDEGNKVYPEFDMKQVDCEVTERINSVI